MRTRASTPDVLQAAGRRATGRESGLPCRWARRCCRAAPDRHRSGCDRRWLRHADRRSGAIAIVAVGELTNVAALDFVWRHTNDWKGETPILFALLPIAALYAPDIATFAPLHVVVDADGLTREVAGQPANAQVAVASDPGKVLESLTARLAR